MVPSLCSGRAKSNKHVRSLEASDKPRIFLDYFYLNGDNDPNEESAFHCEQRAWGALIALKGMRAAIPRSNRGMTVVMRENPIGGRAVNGHIEVQIREVKGTFCVFRWQCGAMHGVEWRETRIALTWMMRYTAMLVPCFPVD